VEFEPGAISIGVHTNNVTYDGVALPNGKGAAPSGGVLVQPEGNTRALVLRQFTGVAESGADGVGGPYDGWFEGLSDGVYTINVDGSKVFDGNGNPGVSRTFVFHRLFGKTTEVTSTQNGLVWDYEAAVGTDDLLAFLNTLGSRSGQGIVLKSKGDLYPGYRRWLDWNGDGEVGEVDHTKFLTNLQSVLRWSV
jgi:hypothetical protein